MELDFEVPEGHVVVRRRFGYGHVSLPHEGRLVAEGDLFHMSAEEAEAREDWEVVEDEAPASNVEQPKSKGKDKTEAVDVNSTDPDHEGGTVSDAPGDGN